MARTRSILLTTFGWVIAGVMGCQQQSMVQNLPPPTFSGPTISPPTLASTTPPPSAPRVRPAPPVTMSGDRLWAPSVQPRPWRWIVVHHSATPSGSAAVFDKMHREKGWDELGYDFVIGNGTESGNGQIEVGSRWVKQKIGAHDNALDNRYNEYGIGICLVGNFEIERPTPQQLQALAKLTSYLMQKYRIPAGNVMGHRDTKDTACPGRNLNITVVRRMATDMLATAGVTIPGDEAQTAAGAELLFETPQR